MCFKDWHDYFENAGADLGHKTRHKPLNPEVVNDVRWAISSNVLILEFVQSAERINQATLVWTVTKSNSLRAG